MGLFDKLFGREATKTDSYEAFWDWFSEKEKTFFRVVKNHRRIEANFFNKIGPKLNQLKEGIFFLTGMQDENTAELILTPDGTIKNIVFVEELVAAAPALPNWKFTALKPAMNIAELGISMNGIEFSKDNLYFFANTHDAYPDEIDLSIVHSDYDKSNEAAFTNGIYIFLDNYLGELNSITQIDSLTIVGKSDTKEPLIPIEKLKDYINWRSKEFIEKYEGVRYDTKEDAHAILEAKLESGNHLIAAINTDILEWENKASHPWISLIDIHYDGKDNNGMPSEEQLLSFDKIEQDLLARLVDHEGNLYIGRQTAENIRTLFFASKDFRLPSKVIHQVTNDWADQYKMEHEIYKDKYWRTFNKFRTI